MPQPPSTRGRFLVVKLGDGEASETFAATCVFNNNFNMNVSKALSETILRNCPEDGTKLPWAINDAQSVSMTCSGDGTLVTGEFATYFAWVVSPLAKNIQIEVYETTAVGGLGDLIGTFAGAFHASSTEVGMPDEGRATQSVELTATGEVTYQAAA